MNRLPLLVAISAALTMCTEGAVAGTLQVVHSIDLDSETILGFGMTWDGELLWVTGIFKERKPLNDGIPFIPQLGPHTFARGFDPTDGSVRYKLVSTRSIPNTRGFVWDGEGFWLASVNVIWGLPVDTVPDPIYRLSDEAALIDTLYPPLSPDAWTSGLAWDGTHLWISDEKHGRIMEVDPADMGVVSWFDSPAREPWGLTWDGSSLWSVHGSSDLIYQIDPWGEVIEMWTAPGTDRHGITYDGQHLWILDNDSRKIYQCAVPEPGTLGLTAVACAGVLLFVCRIGKLSAFVAEEIES